MISCVTPSSLYSDETLLTLNYATRAMNIKNKPVIEVNKEAQKTLDLVQQIEFLSKENEFLKMQWTNAVF